MLKVKYMFEFGESEKENSSAVIKNKLSVYKRLAIRRLCRKITEAYSLVVCLLSIVKNLKLKKRGEYRAQDSCADCTLAQCSAPVVLHRHNAFTSFVARPPSAAVAGFACKACPLYAFRAPQDHVVPLASIPAGAR